MWYGYGRASKAIQEESPARQRANLLEFAQAEGIAFEEIALEHESATKMPYDKRPELSRLLGKLKPGDHLVVWRLDRLDRKMFRLHALIQMLIDRGVTLHTLAEMGGKRIDFDSLTGKIIAFAFGIAGEIYGEQLKDASTRARRELKSRGIASNGASPTGMRRVERVISGRTVKIDVWDSRQVDIMLEIVARHNNGEPLRDIARDFHQRGLRKVGRGGMRAGWWAKRQPSGGIDVSAVADAYHMMTNLLSLGLRPGDEGSDRVWPAIPRKPFSKSPGVRQKCLAILNENGARA